MRDVRTKVISRFPVRGIFRFMRMAEPDSPPRTRASIGPWRSTRRRRRKSWRRTWSWPARNPRLAAASVQSMRPTRSNDRQRSSHMKAILLGAMACAIAGTTALALAQNPAPAVPSPNSQYRLGPDSMPQEGVPKGEIRGPFTLPSKVYEGTQHTYWVYVPAQYDPAIPASLMILQDGQAMKAEEGDVRAQ